MLGKDVASARQSALISTFLHQPSMSGVAGVLPIPQSQGELSELLSTTAALNGNYIIKFIQLVCIHQYGENQNWKRIKRLHGWIQFNIFWMCFSRQLGFRQHHTTSYHFDNPELRWFLQRAHHPMHKVVDLDCFHPKARDRSWHLTKLSIPTILSLLSQRELREWASSWS